MGFNFFGFGRRRRTTRRKMVKKPSKVLSKLCKRYGVKVRSGRSYKSTSTLKKQCAKRIRSLIKRAVKAQKRRKSVRRRKSRRSRFGLKGRGRKGGRKVSRKSKGVRKVTKHRSMAAPMSAPMPVKRRSIFQRLRSGIRSGASKAYRNKGRIAGTAAAVYAATVLGRAARNKHKGEEGGYYSQVKGVLGKDYGRAKSAPGAAYRGAIAAPGAAYRGITGAPGAISSYSSDLYNARANRKDSEKMRTALATEMAKRQGGVREQLAKAEASRQKASLAARLKAAAAKDKTAFGKRRRRYGFGNGGNPPLNASMGYEFCSNGGGVLGANSTGLFPSPCKNMTPAAAAFGKRRRRRY